MQDLYQIASKKIKFRCKLGKNENIKLHLKQVNYWTCYICWCTCVLFLPGSFVEAVSKTGKITCLTEQMNCEFLVQMGKLLH